MPLETSPAAPNALGNYDILSKIAEGGMGTVYRARRKSDGVIVAIKIIPPATAKNAVLLERFKREFQAASALEHPNIVRALDYCGTLPTPFLVMEFVDGESLGQRIEREGKMPEKEAIRIIGQVCLGLHCAHKAGMIHRDIKPDNVLLSTDGTAKLTDLGLIKDADDDMNLTRTGRGLGTPHYMAPEQFRNAKNATVRCDIYSLGATLYAMVTGETPFGGCNPLDTYMRKQEQKIAAPRELVKTLSDKVDYAIRRAMSADPEKRPASCKEFMDDLTTGRPVKQTSTVQHAPAAESAGDRWYMVYTDDENVVQTVKGTTEGIRKALRDSLLGDPQAIRVCRSKAGPFLALTQCTEFSDLVGGGVGQAASVDRLRSSRGFQQSGPLPPAPPARQSGRVSSETPRSQENTATEAWQMDSELRDRLPHIPMSEVRGQRPKRFSARDLITVVALLVAVVAVGVAMYVVLTK